MEKTPFETAGVLDKVQLKDFGEEFYLQNATNRTEISTLYSGKMDNGTLRIFEGIE